MHVTDTLEMVERAYDDWKEGRWSRAPYVDMLIPTQIDPTMAPDGKHYMSVFVQYCPYRLADGDWLLLCTDGLHDMVAPAVIADLLAGSATAEAACGALVEAALANGGKDNVTVVAARYRIPAA